MGLFSKGRINIVITNRFLRYTYPKKNKKGTLAFGEEKLPEGVIKDGKIDKDVAFSKIINKLVKKHKWKGKNLYFCIPDDTVVIRQMQISAALSKEEANAYVRNQIGVSIHLPFADPSIAIEFLSKEQENQNILLFAYPKEKITAFQAVFKEAGLKSVAVDLTSLSVYRYYYQQRDKEKENVLHIHWNQDALELTAYRDHKAIFIRYMKIEALDEVDSEQAKQVITEYTREITRIIDFYQYSITKGEANINLLLLTGDFPFLKLVREELKNVTTIPLHNIREELPIKFVDALGLALKPEVRKGEQ
ncbi:type IV pilus assembly protein PilM [Oceanobacillus limi]|uniref:Type IV pilus assembly protein PilM n=1 Tax=Oceanobacillus limi TaxID=930131 RepID=A0A1I0EKD7_9BACI|nr:pilus assembly protein PilM [Oceanobacillus limi]SET44980.1 type IV pilus assembly protein PilM [Oceanobacillus limi]